MTRECIVGEISPAELKARLDGGDDIVLLDVREPHELEICKLAYTHHIPTGELIARVAELDAARDKDVIIYCRSGQRSGRCCHYMADLGFKRVLNLKGGILAWADEIDNSLTKY